MFWLLALMLWGMLASCKTKYVSVPEYHNVYVEKHDTLMTRDSIYQKDSVYMWMQGDTIWKEKFSILYKDRWRDKIVYRDSIKVDSVRVPFPVEKKLSRMERLRMFGGDAGLTLLLVTIILGVIKIYKLLMARRHIS
jgi:hypothetical protein